MEPLRDQLGRTLQCGYFDWDEELNTGIRCSNPAVQITRDEYGNKNFACEEHIKELSHIGMFIHEQA